MKRLIGLAAIALIGYGVHTTIEDGGEGGGNGESLIDAGRMNREMMRESADLLQRNIDGEATCAQALKLLIKHNNVLREMAEDASGKQAAALHAMADAHHTLIKPFRALTTAAAPLETFSLATLTSEGMITTTERNVAVFRRENTNVLRAAVNFEHLLRRYLERRNLGKKDIENIMATWRKDKGKWMPHLRTVRTMDRKMGDHLAALLQILRAHWGHWHLKGNTVVFDNRAGCARFNAAVNAVRQAAAKQKAAQKKFIAYLRESI